MKSSCCLLCTSALVTCCVVPWAVPFAQEYPLPDGVVLRLAEGEPPVSEYPRGRLDIARDGSLLLHINPDGVTRLWEIEEGLTSATLVRTILDVSDATISPQGDWLAVLNRSSRLSVEIQDSLTGEVLRVLESTGRVNGIDFFPDGARLAVGHTTYQDDDEFHTACI